VVEVNVGFVETSDEVFASVDWLLSRKRGKLRVGVMVSV
jgi:hypothetical protein